MPPSETRTRPPRPVHRRSRLGCKTCKRRRKKCSNQYNKDGVCERCEMGGFECEPGEGSLSLSVSTPPSTSSSSTPPSSTPSPHPQPQPPPLYRQSPMSLGSAPISEPSYTLPLPAPAPFSHSGYLIAYPYSSGYVDPSTYALAPAFGPAPPSSFGSFADFSYSASLLDMLNSLPPIMPAPGQYSPSAELGQSLLGLGSAQRSRRRGGSEDVVRSFILKELAEGEEMGSIAAEAEIGLTAELYCDVDDEWLRVWQPTQRRLVKDLMDGTVTSSPSSRAACLAVAAGLRARLLLPDDSRRQQFIEKSDCYHDQAMQMLISAPFEVQAGTLFDLMIYQTEQYGPAAGYAVQELVDALVLSHPQLGPHPIPFIEGAPGHLNFLLQGVFAMDVLRSLALSRRTLFDIPSSAALPTFTLVGGVTIDKNTEVMRGVAPQFLLFFGRMCNLAMDEKEGLVGSAELQLGAEALEREIIGWQPAVSASEGRSEDEMMECFATQEMWRHALLINLRQDLYHRGSLHSSIRTSLDSILSFGSSPVSVSSSNSSTLLSSKNSFLERSVPWFIAATCATCKHDRAVLRQAFAQKSPFFGVDNLPAVERIWAATDEAGYPLDWREVLRKEGVSMMLM